MTAVLEILSWMDYKGWGIHSWITDKGNTVRVQSRYEVCWVCFLLMWYVGWLKVTWGLEGISQFHFQVAKENSLQESGAQIMEKADYWPPFSATCSVKFLYNPRTTSTNASTHSILDDSALINSQEDSSQTYP